MLPLRFLLAAAAACCLPTAFAVDFSSSSLIARDNSSDALAALAAALPACGLSCVEAGAIAESCLDIECMCTSAAFSSYVTECVAYNCTIIEQLSVKNVTSSGCGVPERNRGTQYNTMSIVLSVISATAFLARMGYKLLEARVQLGLDDWCIIATMLSGAASTIITARGTVPNGLGRDIWTLEPAMITSFVYWFYHMEYAYFLNLVLLKASILFFYLKIFPNRTVRRLLWATVAYNALWGTLFVVLSIFQCSPVSYYWTSWDGLHRGACLDTNAIAWANAISSIVEDIWMVAIPLSQLRGLQLHFKKKVGVAIMFCTGTFVTIMSIIRLRTLITFANSTNVTWDNLELAQWSDIEINVGIICACMPTLRLLLVKFFPILSSTRRGYGYGYDNGNGYGGGNSGGAGAGARYMHNNSRSMRSHHGDGGISTINTTTTTTTNGTLGKSGGGGGGAGGGITYQRSYAVQYDDADERSSSQVHLKDLDSKGFDASHTNVSEWSA